jgi:hypothetical protein
MDKVLQGQPSEPAKRIEGRQFAEFECFAHAENLDGPGSVRFSGY